MNDSCETLIRPLLDGLNKWVEAPDDATKKAIDFRDSIIETKPKNHRTTLKQVDATIENYRSSRRREAAETISKVLREIQIYLEPSAPPAKRGRKPGPSGKKAAPRA